MVRHYNRLIFFGLFLWSKACFHPLKTIIVHHGQHVPFIQFKPGMLLMVRVRTFQVITGFNFPIGSNLLCNQTPYLTRIKSLNIGLKCEYVESCEKKSLRSLKTPLCECLLDRLETNSIVLKFVPKRVVH